MKKTYLLVLIFLVLTIVTIAKPDEGMWIPSKIAELNYAKMQKLGCKLTAEEIYSINNSSLKDAIFQLQNGNGDGFCTGEIVSTKGLLFTNHHCGYEAITKLSSTEHNYLDNGYWAKNLNEEIYVPDMQVSRVVRIEDVTSKVLEGINEKTDEEVRTAAIQAAIGEIETNAIEGTHYKASVSEMYQGGEYYLFVYETFGDVRFVGAPPSSIGKFGGDTDNWIWPRHTGDFSIFRVYMSPDGKPTETYSENNIPYKPLHSLPISIKPLNEGDFTMILGFPGSTERYLSSYGMTYKRDYFNPSIVNLFGAKLDTQKRFMDENIEIRLSIADDYASYANTHKLLGGQMNVLSTTDAIEQRAKLQEEFTKWINQDKARQEKYGDVLENLKNKYEALGDPTLDLYYAIFGLLRSSDNIALMRQVMNLGESLKDKSVTASEIAEYTQQIKSLSDETFEKYYPQMDKKVFETLLKTYYNNIPAESRNSVFNNYIFKTYKGKTEIESIEKFVETVYEKSIMTDKSRMDAFLAKPNSKKLEKDPMNIYINTLLSNAMTAQMNYIFATNGIDELERIFIQGLREFQPNAIFYPDANFTLRLTYGTVRSYYPRDAVHYKYITYAEGILEKEDPANSEFTISKDLKEKILKKDFGQYADTNGRLPVCFLSDNDITGGNSGSPIINSEGELIGLAFDGNLEWLCSDYIFSDDFQRTINVDSRYVLWVIDKLYDAKNIIEELDIRK